MPRRPTEPESRLVVGVWGEPKTGKSHFALTFPEPLRVINTDYGIDIPAAKFKSKDIEIEDIPVFDPGNHERAQAALQLFHETYSMWVEEVGPQGGTIIIDNASYLWEIVSLVKNEEALRERFARQSKVKNPEDLKESRFDWGKANSYMNSMMRRVYAHPKLNAVFVLSAKNKYSDVGQELAAVQPKGFSSTGSIVEAMLQTFKHEGEFRLLVDTSRHAPSEQGMWLANPTYEVIRDLLVES